MSCAVDGCDRSGRLVRGWCPMHYSRWRRHGDVHAYARPTYSDEYCSVDGCDKPALSRGWCTGHYGRWRTKGDVQADTPLQKRNPAPCPRSEIQRRIKLILVATHGGTCVDCDGAFRPECFDFHHRNPDYKDFTLAQVSQSSAGLNRAIRESSKCDLLCANCHRTRHVRLNRQDA